MKKDLITAAKAIVVLFVAMGVILLINNYSLINGKKESNNNLSSTSDLTHEINRTYNDALNGAIWVGMSFDYFSIATKRKYKITLTHESKYSKSLVCDYENKSYYFENNELISITSY